MSTATSRESIRQFFARHAIAPSRVVLALSGGVDSTALLVLLSDFRDEGFTLFAAHVNHHLRGAESDEDEAFVRELCARFEIPLDVADGALDPERVRDRGIEAAAREVRYARFLEIREAREARFLATAHQKDDQAETVLMRLLSGSGIAGLRGIHPVREDGVIRPLLDIRRTELEAVLTECGITARFDRSNADPRFLRNRLRPLIRELEATNNLALIAEQATAQWPILERALAAAESECVEVRDDETVFRDLPGNDWLRGALLQRHVRRLDPEARDFDVAKIDLTARRVSVTKNVEAVREGEAWHLRRRPVEGGRANFSGEIAFTDETHIPELQLTIRVARADRQPLAATHHPAKRQRFQLPEGAHPRFTVRTRRPGDRFHPLGLTGSKKLKDFLIDRRIARVRRDSLPLLCWNGEIVWIAGVEVSERFKVTSPAHGTLYEVWLEGSGADDADHSPV